MKIKFNVDDFLPQLTQVASVVSNKNSLAILASVMIEVRDSNVVVLTTSDSNVYLSTKVQVSECDVPTGEKFCIDAKQLLQAMKGLGGRVLEMTLDDRKHVVNCSYGKGKFGLPYVYADEYPMPTTPTGKEERHDIPAPNLYNALASTDFAMANEELRIIMNGVNFDFTKDGLVCVATNGQKLAMHKDNGIKRDGDEISGFILPSKPTLLLLSLLQKAEDTISVMFTDTKVYVCDKNFMLTSRLIEGRYPNYNSVIPKEWAKEVTMDKVELEGAIKRILPMGSASTQLVKFEFMPNVLTLSCEDIDYSTNASEDVDCDFEGDKFVIAFKGDLVLQCLQSIVDEKVKMRLVGEANPCLILGATETMDTEYLALVMPMRLND